jgi:hypothetical protein
VGCLGGGRGSRCIVACGVISRYVGCSCDLRRLIGYCVLGSELYTRGGKPLAPGMKERGWVLLKSFSLAAKDSPRSRPIRRKTV